MGKLRPNRATFIMQPRDHAVLDLLHKFDYVPTNLIGLWCGFQSRRHLYRRLQGLREAKLIDSQQLIVGMTFYRLTRQGLDYLGFESERVKPIRLGSVEHEVGLQTCLAYLVHSAERLSFDALLTEKEVRRRVDLGSGQLGGDFLRPHIPDAAYKLGDTWVYVDFERTKKSAERYKHIFGLLNSDAPQNLPNIPGKLVSYWFFEQGRGNIKAALEDGSSHPDSGTRGRLETKFVPAENLMAQVAACFQGDHIYRGKARDGELVPNRLFDAMGDTPPLDDFAKKFGTLKRPGGRRRKQRK